jgi:hypothetical protein
MPTFSEATKPAAEAVESIWHSSARDHQSEATRAARYKRDFAD